MDLLHSDFSVLKCRSVLVANRVMQANLTPAFPQLVPIRRENRIPIFGPSCKSLFRSPASNPSSEQRRRSLVRPGSS
jgi:hypothetical protein